MAEMRRPRGGVGRPLDLGLQEADAIVKLVGYRELLVGGGRTGADKRAVVGAYFGDVAVFAVAEFRVVVAGTSVGWGRNVSRGAG